MVATATKTLPPCNGHVVLIFFFYNSFFGNTK